jgi:hypothetical protein
MLKWCMLSITGIGKCLELTWLVLAETRHLVVLIIYIWQFDIVLISIIAEVSEF